MNYKIIQWYKSLNSHQRYVLKEDCEILCGVSWTDLGKIFSPIERIALIKNKLEIEGII